MNRVRTVCVVDEAHNSFTTFGHPERRTRRDSIVSHQASLAKVGIDLLFERPNVDLVVVNWWAVCERDRSETWSEKRQCSQ